MKNKIIKAWGIVDGERFIKVDKSYGWTLREVNDLRKIFGKNSKYKVVQVEIKILK